MARKPKRAPRPGPPVPTPTPHGKRTRLSTAGLLLPKPSLFDRVVNWWLSR